MANSPTVAFNLYKDLPVTASYMRETGGLGLKGYKDGLYDQIIQEAPRTADGRIDLGGALLSRSSADVSRINTMPETGIMPLPEGGMVLPISEGHTSSRLALPTASLGATIGVLAGLMVMTGAETAGPVSFGLAAAAVMARAGLALVDDRVHADHRGGILLDTDKTQFTQDEFSAVWAKKRFVNFKDAEEPQTVSAPRSPVALAM